MTFYEYFVQYVTQYDHVLNNEKTMIRYCFELKKLIDFLSPEFLLKLDNDIDTLVTDRIYLLDFELEFHKYHSDKYKSNFFLFEKILSHYCNKKVLRPSIFQCGVHKFRLIDLYALNIELTELLKIRITQAFKDITPASQKKKFLDIRKLILRSNKYSTASTLENLVDSITNNLKLDKSEINTLNNLVISDVTIIKMGNQDHDITRLNKLNPNIYSDYKYLNSVLKTEYDYRRIFLFTRFLNKYLDENIKDEILISKFGLQAFIKNDFELLLKFKYSLKLKYFNYIIFIIEKLIGNKVDYEKYDTRCLCIPLRTKNVARIHLDDMYNKSSGFAIEFYYFFSEYIKNIKYSNSNETTAMMNISKLNNIFSTYTNKETLDKYGLDVLISEDYKYFRLIKSKINERYLRGEIKISTQVNYFNVLKWFCELKGQKYINDYDINITSNKKLSKYDSHLKCYNEDELSDIINHIIKAININHEDNSKKILMYIALIIILTGWNISSISDLKLDSIELDNQNNNLYHVKFNKPRANYDTHTHSFFKNSNDKTIYLLLYVRDVLRAKILAERKNIDFQTDHLFICLNTRGYAQVAHMSYTVQRINEILMHAGCSVRFNTVQMRKTVANKLFKIVLKKFSHYRELIHHDFNTFIQHYEELNIVENNVKLSNGTKALEIYLNTKNISLEPPKIKNSSDNIIQFTPIGNCSSVVESNVSICSDYLACIFCKNFSVVNTEAQIHKLLDFQNTCINQMIELSSSFNSDNKTKIAINEIEIRIKYILDLLKQNNSNIYEKAKENYLENKFFSL